MSIVSIIGAERERYASYFEAAFENVRAGNTQSARELLISINNEALPYPYRYLRVDAVEKRSDGTDQPYEFWLDPSQEAEARGFQLGPVAIEMYPFTWCATQVAFDRAPDTGKLEAFLTTWLDTNDARASGGSGAANAIHSASPIETNGELSYLTIDFGTAPSDALLDLIDLVGNEGADRIIIVSHSRQG
jgi:hypothetical protein